MAPKVLVVLTSQATMKTTGAPTGWFLPEFAHPYWVLAGRDEKAPKAEIVVASPLGDKAPLDQGSVEMFRGDLDAIEFLNERKHLWEETTPLKEFLGRASEFDALFYPGGHGPMFDLVDDKDSQQLIREFYETGKPVAAVCHGPIVFINVEVGGKPLLEGREATGFSNVEEEAVGLTSAMPKLLEDEIKRVGGKYVIAEGAWNPKVVVDGQIITGQNPASSHGVGIVLAQAIGL